MKKWKDIKRLSFIFLAGCALLNPAFTQAEPYKVGILNFPPYSVIEKSGRYKGILVELLEKVLKKADVSYAVTPVPQKRLFNNLATGNTDIYMGIKGVPGYEGKVIFSDFGVADIDLRVYSLKGKPLIQTRDQLKGKKLIVIMGYGYGGLIRYLKDPANRIAIDPTSTHVLAFRKLKAGRADYVLDYRRPGNIAVSEEGMTQEVLSHSIAKLNIYFIVSKKTPDAQRLMKRMEDAYEALKAEGKL